MHKVMNFIIQCSMKLSLTLIMKDEKETIARVLNSAKQFCDEMIVVDTGSTDGSMDLAIECGATVYDFKWNNNFSDARNYAINQATGDYGIWLDADDTISQPEIEKILELKRNDFFDADIVMLKYKISESFSFFRERIFKLNKTHYFEGFVHESICLSGKVIKQDIEIEHKKLKSAGSRNLDIYLSHDKTKFSPRERYYFARELYYNGYYEEAGKEFENFLIVGNFNPNLIDAAVLKNRCDKKTKNGNIDTLLKALKYGITPLLCCEIAQYFFERKEWKNAILWYTYAQNCDDMADEGAFCDDSYKSLIPLLQLTLCYYNQGEMEKAKDVAKKAYTLFPNNQKTIHNAKWAKIID